MQWCKRFQYNNTFQNIVVFAEYFEVESDKYCAFDWLVICATLVNARGGDTKEPHTRILCGHVDSQGNHSKSALYISHSSVVALQFVSDSMVQLRGFRLRIEAKTDSQLTG